MNRFLTIVLLFLTVGSLGAQQVTNKWSAIVGNAAGIGTNSDYVLVLQAAGTASGYTNRLMEISNVLKTFIGLNNWKAAVMVPSAQLSNIVGLASTVFTNVPLGGTNINVRTTGGTNFFDVTGYLAQWALYPTNGITASASNAIAIQQGNGNSNTFTNIVIISPATISGSGAALMNLYATNGSSWTQIKVADNISNVSITLPTNGINGIMYATATSVSNIQLFAVPDGTTGQALFKTSTGYAYSNAASSGGTTIFTNVSLRTNGGSGQAITFDFNGPPVMDLTPTNNVGIMFTNLPTTNAATLLLWVYPRGYTNITFSNAVATVSDIVYDTTKTNAFQFAWNGTNVVAVSVRSAASSGEVNVNGEVSVTNATTVGLVYGKTGVTNLLRSLRAGANVVLTNEGTNIMITSTASGGGTQIFTNNSAVTNLGGNKLATLDFIGPPTAHWWPTNDAMVVMTNIPSSTNSAVITLIVGPGGWTNFAFSNALFLTPSGVAGTPSANRLSNNTFQVFWTGSNIVARGLQDTNYNTGGSGSGIATSFGLGTNTTIRGSSTNEFNVVSNQLVTSKATNAGNLNVQGFIQMENRQTSKIYGVDGYGFLTNTLVPLAPDINASFGASIQSDGTNWQQVSGPGRWIFDEEFIGQDTATSTLIGQNQWSITSGGNIVNPVHAPNPWWSEPGYVTCQSTQTHSGRIYYLTANTSSGPLYLTNAEFFITAKFAIGQTNSTTDTTTFRVGVSDYQTSTNDPARGIYVMVRTNASASLQLVGVTATSSSYTFTENAATAFETNQMVTVGIRPHPYGTNVVFYWGTNSSTLVPFATNTTTIPNGFDMNPFFQTHRIVSSSGTATHSTYMAKFSIYYRPLDQ